MEEYGDTEECAANDQFHEDHNDADDYQAVNNMEEDMAEYSYDEQSEEDIKEKFPMYCDEDERIEEQNADLKPDVLWLPMYSVVFVEWCCSSW